MTELLADVRCPLGHAEAWRRVVLAERFEELLVALGYSAGFAKFQCATCAADSPSARLAEGLGNAAKAFAALLRSPVPLDIDPCVRAYHAQVRVLLRNVARHGSAEATRPPW